MTTWFSDTVMANGIKLHYHRTGGGDKPPVVLCHGLTDNGLCWLRVAQVLQQDFDLIMVDARGHGLSDVPENGYSSEEHATDIVGLIEALHLEKPHLIGHSMGASIVATVIAHNPNLVGRAILEDPPWREIDMVSQPAAEKNAMVEQWQTDLVNRKILSQVELTNVGRELHPAWHDIEFGPWIESIYQASPNVVKFITQNRTPWQELAVKISTPTLLLMGDVENDAIVTVPVAEVVTRLQPNIRVACINGAGHSIRREQFERYVEVVSGFLKQK